MLIQYFAFKFITSESYMLPPKLEMPAKYNPAAKQREEF